jgi:hypothetical protein
MSDKKERVDPSASRGSHGDAIGWVMFKNGKMVFDAVWTDRDEAEKYCLGAYSGTAEVVGVYRQPQLTLTDEEREALEWAVEVADSLAECSGAGTAASHHARPPRSAACSRGRRGCGGSGRAWSEYVRDCTVCHASGRGVLGIALARRGVGCWCVRRDCCSSAEACRGASF